MIKVQEAQIPESAETQKANHQSRILDAAAQTFLEKGYEETSTAEIARRAKVSKRELYSHFDDKRDILAAVITQLQTEIVSQAKISWSSSDNIRNVLTEAGTQILEFITSKRFGKLFRIVAAESFRDPVSARKFYLLGPGLGRDNTAAFMRRQIKAGNLRNADPMQAADDFLDLVVSSRRLTAVVLGQHHDSQPPPAHVKHAVDVFLQYYGAQPVARETGRSDRTARLNGKRLAKKGGDAVRSRR